MSYLEELRKSKNKEHIAFTEFMLSTRKFPQHLFCFFEGKDNAYYVPRIKHFTSKYYPIKCGGRDKVLAVYKLITEKKEYKDYKKGFFIDRDFNSQLLPHTPPIFETPCYSIESFYVSANVFREILINEFHLSEVSDTNFEVCLNLFIERQNEFHNAVLLFNAWYACLIDIRNQTGEQTGINLADKLPKGWIDFSLLEIKKNYDFAKIQETFSKANTVLLENLEAKITEFERCEQHKVFRGKYEMEFLVKFIKLLLKKPEFEGKKNFSFGDGSTLNTEQAINIFSAYAETPESLNEYLVEVI